MLDLAISIDADSRNRTIIETNHGVQLKAPEWPQDVDFQLVAFDVSGNTCEVVSAEGLTDDIREAITMIEKVAPFRGPKPDWYCRLQRYATAGLLP
jgi:hypothetical protein